MPTRQEILIQDLVDALEGAVTKWNDGLPAIQSKQYKAALDLISELETTSTRPKRLKVSLRNAKIIARIKVQMKDAIANDAYLKSVDEYLKAWDKVDKINAAYFSTITSTWRPGTVFAELKKQAIESTKEALLGSGINANVTGKLNDILQQNITTGGKYADFTEQVRTFLMNDEAGDGALARYSKVYSIDAINNYNRQYTKLATDDLGLEWYQYVGSLLTTSREFCVKMIEAKKGCMPFIHVSQFPELLQGHICGDNIHIYDKTGLPDGMKANTTIYNLAEVAGGWGCYHAFIPVDEAIVPDELVAKFKGK